MLTAFRALLFLPSLRRRFTRGSLARDVSTLGGLTVLSQIAALALMPLVTRLYSPGQFGIFAAFTSISMFLSVLACGRYEMAIVLPRSVEHARILLLLCLLLTLATSSVVMVGLWSLSHFAPRDETFSKLFDYAPLVAISMTATSVRSTASYWFIRKKQFQTNGLLALSNVALLLVLQISFALIFGPSWLMLIVAMTVAQSFVMLACIVKLASSGAFRYSTKKRLFKRIAILARQHAKLPLFSAPANLVNTAAYQSQIILMPLYFSPAIVGQLALTMRTVRVPVRLISASLGQVLTQRLANNVARGVSNVPITVNTVRLLALASVSFVVPLALWAPNIYAFVFGNQWREAGTYTTFLLPMIMVNLCVIPTAKMFIYKKNNVGLLWQICFAVGLIGTIVVGGALRRPYLAVGLYSLVGTVLYLILLTLTLKYAGGSWKNMFQSKRVLALLKMKPTFLD